MLEHARSTAILLLLMAITACGDGGDRGASPAPVPSVTASTYEQYDGLFAEWRDAFVECARAEGLDASVPPDGAGIDGGSRADRPVDDATGLDGKCIADVGQPPASPPLTPGVLNGLYDLSVEQAKCLRAAGFPVSEPPAREVWVEAYEGTDPPWLPLDAVFSSGGDVVAAVEACPDPDPRDVAP